MFRRNKIMRLQSHQFRSHRFPPLVDPSMMSEPTAASRSVEANDLNDEFGMGSFGFDESGLDDHGLDDLGMDEFDLGFDDIAADEQGSSKLEQEPQDSVSNEEFQVQFNQGFQQGMSRGHDEGVQQGILQGQQQGFEQGVKDGHEQGLMQGFQEGKEHFVKAASPFDQMHKKMAMLFAEHERRQREQVCELVQKVAQQVIRGELALQPQQILTLIDETLESLPGEPDGLKVRMAREEFAHIEKVASDKIQEWNIVCDDTLRQGECRVATKTAEADAGCEQRLDTCIAAVKSHLLDEQIVIETDDQAEPEVLNDEVVRQAS
ncbi:flagellar assembly protein H [Photobacterium makurazakiensis]|uniref:flagellar assembly protein FliH n=1 Tax=Photobacterium makurazakiensis TaxID=2910234 RepID=UPI003D0C9BFA